MLGLHFSALSNGFDYSSDAAGFSFDVSILLHRARKARGLSQTELARRLGRSQQAVSQIERPGSNPTMETLALYLGALGYRIELAIAESVSNKGSHAW